MSILRLVAGVVTALLFVSGSWAQVNELSATVGRTFVSTQTIQNANFCGCETSLHFAAEETVGLNYSRLLTNRELFGLWVEVPVAFNRTTNLSLVRNLVPKSYSAFFVAPAVRLNFFNDQAVSPWVSFGGGYSAFSASDKLVFFGDNPGQKRTNTGALQVGTGLDVFPWDKWGVRLEARDFWTGAPNLNIDTGRSRQHNYYVGGGVIYRF